MPPCAICENSYETPPYICKHCRRDPANADWVKSVDNEADESQANYVVEQWSPDETDRKIARALLLGDTSLRGAAREAGCSLTRVQAFVKRVMTSQPEACRIWPQTLQRTDAMRSCKHLRWDERSDLGTGCYTCSACGIPGRRSLPRGTVTPGIRHAGHRTPPQTVGFKALGEPPDPEDVGARARLRPTHSNRHDDLYNDGDDIEPTTED